MIYETVPARNMESTQGHDCVLDVRTAAEVASESVPGSIHIPLHELSAEKLNQALKQREGEVKNLYLLCQSGKRAETAARQLAGAIDCNLLVVEGGVNALRQCRVPLETGAGKVISLERQVRIAAGSLVVLGVLLGALLHPGFYALAGFVGAGLTFAGITDTCAMGMLLARMPWNRG